MAQDISWCLRKILFLIVKHIVMHYAVILTIYEYTFIKLKLPVFVGPLSAIQSFSQPSTTFNFPWPLGYIRKLAFRSPGGSYFTPGFVCSQHTPPPLDHLLYNTWIWIQTFFIHKI